MVIFISTTTMNDLMDIQVANKLSGFLQTAFQQLKQQLCASGAGGAL